MVEIPVDDALSGWTAWWIDTSSGSPAWELLTSETASGAVADGLSLGSDAKAYPTYAGDWRSALYFPLGDALVGQTPTQVDLVLWTDYFWDGIGSGTFYLIPLTDDTPENGPPITIASHHPEAWLDKSGRSIWSITLGDFEATYNPGAGPVQITIPIAPELIAERDGIGFQTAILTGASIEDQPDSNVDFQKDGFTRGGGSGPILRLLYGAGQPVDLGAAAIQSGVFVGAMLLADRAISGTATAALAASGNATIPHERRILTHAAKQNRDRGRS